MTSIQTFEITENHLKLLKHMCVEWNDMEFGAPSIDPKRPYGNSDVYEDISSILGLPTPDYDNDEDFTDEQVEYMDKIHEEMETVLQIGLKLGYFKQGIYMAENLRQNWVLVNLT